jgi:hypothetical protein
MCLTLWDHLMFKNKDKSKYLGILNFKIYERGISDEKVFRNKFPSKQ